MTAPKALRDVIRPGATFEITNHYITREDHPCYGTRTDTIRAVNSASFYLSNGGIKWPTRGHYAVWAEDGAVTLYGYGAGQGPTDLFMTLKPIRED